MSDDRLREAFAHAGPAAKSAADCPAAERIWDAVCGVLDPAETRGIVAHTSTCAACAEAWRLAREAGAEPEASAEAEEPREAGVTSIGATRARRPRWAIPASATAILAAAALLFVVFGKPPGEPQRRGGTTDIRSLVDEQTPLPRDAARLRWTEGPAGWRYEVRLLTPELELVHRQDGLERPEYAIPPAALARWSGSELLWQVDVVAPDGGRRSSAIFRLRLR